MKVRRKAIVLATICDDMGDGFSKYYNREQASFVGKEILVGESKVDRRSGDPDCEQVGSDWWWKEQDLVFINDGKPVFKKSDLENGQIVTLATGKRYVYITFGESEGMFVSKDGYLDVACFSDNLEHFPFYTDFAVTDISDKSTRWIYDVSSILI